MTLAEMIAACEAALAKLNPPYEYDGMIGDPGQPLAHFISDGDTQPAFFSRDFAADYGGLDKPMRIIAALLNAAPGMLAAAKAFPPNGYQAQGAACMLQPLYDALVAAGAITPEVA